MPVGEETAYQKISRESSALTGIKNFVKVCSQQLAQTLGQSPKKETEFFRFVAQNIKETFSVKFLSRSYTYAVVVQDIIKRDAKWKNLATIEIQHTMSVDAPTFKPNLTSSSMSPVRMPILSPTEDQEILK